MNENLRSLVRKPMTLDSTLIQPTVNSQNNNLHLNNNSYKYNPNNVNCQSSLPCSSTNVLSINGKDDPTKTTNDYTNRLTKDLQMPRTFTHHPNNADQNILQGLF